MTSSTPSRGSASPSTTMFRKVDTVQYPEEKRPTAPRFHGRHQLNRWPDGLEKCIGCELCAWACPADAIYVEGADNTADERYSPGERYGRVYQINYLRCILCGLCIEACPTRALTMTNEYELADDSRESLIWTKEQLLAPLQSGMEAPPHPMRLGDDRKGLLPARRGRDRHLGAGARVRRPPPPRPTPAARRPGSGLGRRRDDPAQRPAGGRRGRRQRAPRGGRMTHVLASAGSPPPPPPDGHLLDPGGRLGRPAFGMVLARRAVHCAAVAGRVMLSLAVLYAMQGAPFLAFVQIIVYTGAVLMLFLFVLMLVGVSSADSLVETIRGSGCGPRPRRHRPAGPAGPGHRPRRPRPAPRRAAPTAASAT